MDGLIAFEKFESELENELKRLNAKIHFQKNGLFLVDLPAQSPDPIWAKMTSRNGRIVDFNSINEAAKILKSENKFWCHYSFHLHRRSELIQEQVCKIKKSPLEFLKNPYKHKLGLFCLVEDKKMFLAPNSNTLFPLGDIQFQENKNIPPSRAYLKLWELFTCHFQGPKPNETVLDMGACPGGWSWVLHEMGTNVIAVDKAPLDPKIQKLPRIQTLKKDAFALKPEDIPQVDWFFSDIICYPHDLYDLVLKWKASGKIKNFVCTIKYQKQTDFETTQKFLEIPNSRIIHLCANKHEVTWICC